MASLNSYQNSILLLITITVLLLLHLLLLSPVSCFNIQPQTPNIPPLDLLFEEKNRLGSIPPTCHNKCNQCHPCMAVQVPNLPGHDHEHIQQSPSTPNAAAMEEGFFPQGNNNRYSNYKPLSWKCHCGGHFFNP